MEQQRIAVTGATGAIGGRVARRLAEAGVAQRLIVRDVARAADIAGAEVAAAQYADVSAMREALTGATTLFFVSAHEDPDRVALHKGVVDAAVDAGVQRIVYTSFLAAAPDATFTFARDHYFTEELIRSSGMAWTFLRDSLYADFVPMMCGDDGVIRGPGGDGAVAVVTRDDIADVAAAVLLGSGHDGATYDITGPESLTLEQMAAQLSAVTGGTIRYVDETLEEARASRASYGAPEYILQGWITTYEAIASGELDHVSDTVERIAGHPPQTLIEYLRQHPQDYGRLVR